MSRLPKRPVTLPNVCPDTCPDCHLDLKREGYPYSHQHSWTGDECTFRWEPTGALDPEWDPNS